MEKRNEEIIKRRQVYSRHFTKTVRRLQNLSRNHFGNHKKTGLPIRNQNPPEDITENIVKFLIKNKEKDATVKWAKAVCLNGDLYSDNYDHEYPIEIKALTSDGPSSF